MLQEWKSAARAEWILYFMALGPAVIVWAFAPIYLLRSQLGSISTALRVLASTAIYFVFSVLLFFSCQFLFTANLPGVLNYFFLIIMPVVLLRMYLFALFARKPTPLAGRYPGPLALLCALLLYIALLFASAELAKLLHPSLGA